MRESEEIKRYLKSMEYCNKHESCTGCPADRLEFEKTCRCFHDAEFYADALAYIDQLEEQVTLMKIQMHGDCGVCKHRTGFDVEGAIMSQTCYACMIKETRPNWEYEGLPEV